MPTPHHNNFRHAVSVLTLKHDPMPLDLRDISSDLLHQLAQLHGKLQLPAPTTRRTWSHELDGHLKLVWRRGDLSLTLVTSSESGSRSPLNHTARLTLRDAKANTVLREETVDLYRSEPLIVSFDRVNFRHPLVFALRAFHWSGVLPSLSTPTQA